MERDGKMGVQLDGSIGVGVSRLEVIGGPSGRRRRTKAERARIAAEMRAHLRDADRIFVDETRAPVLEPGLKRTKSGFFWAVVSDDRGHGGAGPPIVLFHYAPGRGKAHPLNFLAGYHGRFLQCDAYQSYNAMTEIARDNGPWQLVYCWTHVRRRFVKRFESDGSPIAEEMLRQIALLYQIEKGLRGHFCNNTR